MVHKSISDGHGYIYLDKNLVLMRTYFYDFYKTRQKIK